MPFQAGTLDSSTYALINGALMQNGFNNMKVFFDTAFADLYSQVRWTQLYDNIDGNYTGEYRQMIGSKTLPVMARYVAYDGEAPKISTDLVTVSGKDMPRMKLGFDNNEKSMLEFKKLVQQMGATPPAQQIFNMFSKNATDLLTGLHNQISYTGLQILSTGKYTSTQENNGGGLVGLEFDFQVPEANKKKAGGFGSQGAKYAWSSSSADPIGDLLDIEAYAIANFIPIGVYNMNQATWLIFKNHPNVRSRVAIQLTQGGIESSNLTKYSVTDAQIMSYVEGLGIHPIEVIQDLFSLPVYDEATRSLKKSTIRGFADNVVVARPAGSFGELQWTFPDESYAAGSDYQFTTEGGKFLLTTITDAKKKSTETFVEFTGIPVPNRIDQTLYLDISQAAS